jgi:hypothetical protein
MDDRANSPPIVPTAAWLAEQRAKQERYATERRRWRERIERRAMPEREPVSAADPAGATEPVRNARRPRGVLHDPRQTKFDF